MHGEAQVSELITPRGNTLFADDFTGDLSNWRHEGTGVVELSERDGAPVMRLDCTGSRQGGAGTHAFCLHDFPDGIAVEYTLFVEKSNGLVITFVAMKGVDGEDMFADSLPARTGVFKDYTGDDAALRSYHVSVSRYNDKGEHTGTSNWRRNPGLHLVGAGPDLCETIGRPYEIRIVKDGVHMRLGVNGKLAHEFVDPEELPGPVPDAGKVGFRAIGSEVVAEIGDFRVTLLR